jgi:hypothetical protein
MNDMQTKLSSALLVRRGVLSAIMIGLSLAFIVYGRTPGPLLYVASGVLALLFFLASFTKWKGTGWVGVLAYTLLVSGMLVGTNGILGLLTGLFLAALTALQASRMAEEEDKTPEEADGSLDRFQPETQ